VSFALIDLRDDKKFLDSPYGERNSPRKRKWILANRPGRDPRQQVWRLTAKGRGYVIKRGRGRGLRPKLKRRPIRAIEPQPPPIQLHGELSAFDGQRTETVVYCRGRNRRLRLQALSKAKGVCEACLTDYSRILHGKGVRALQVHHRKQLAAFDEPKLTKPHDLAVVCATCHVLIHMNPKRAIKVELLRRLLRARRA
jgi:hypothetical protein